MSGPQRWPTGREVARRAGVGLMGIALSSQAPRRESHTQLVTRGSLGSDELVSVACVHGPGAGNLRLNGQAHSAECMIGDDSDGATTHNLVGLRWRSTASAILLLVINIIGLGLGPFAIGFLSDFLAPTLGAESLRYSMLILLPTVMIWSSIHFYLASRTMLVELEQAPE